MTELMGILIYIGVSMVIFALMVQYKLDEDLIVLVPAMWPLILLAIVIGLPLAFFMSLPDVYARQKELSKQRKIEREKEIKDNDTNNS